MAAAAVLGFAGFLMLIQKPNRSVKIEDLRKAYDGLSPERRVNNPALMSRRQRMINVFKES